MPERRLFLSLTFFADHFLQERTCFVFSLLLRVFAIGIMRCVNRVLYAWHLTALSAFSPDSAESPSRVGASRAGGDPGKVTHALFVSVKALVRSPLTEQRRVKCQQADFGCSAIAAC